MLVLVVLMHATGLIVCMNMFIDVKTGLQILGVLLVIIYGFVAYMFYRKNDYRWPKIIKIINFLLVIAVSTSLIVVAVFDDSFNQFEACSITCALIVLLLVTGSFMLL